MKYFYGILLSACLCFFNCGFSWAATVTWDGGGGNTSWQTAANWSDDTLPGPGDDVVINLAGALTVTSSANVTIQSLQCSNHLEIASGTFAVTNGLSEVSGDLTVGSMATLSVSGGTTMFLASGQVQADDGSFSVTDGAAIHLPTLTAYAKGPNCRDRLWRVSGTGSRLEMPALTDLSGGSCVALKIQALDGGVIRLTNVASLPDGHITMLADGTNSLVDLTSLQECLGTIRTTTLEARDGGTIQVPQLLGGPKVTVTLKPGGVLPVTQMTELSGIVVESRTETFSSLVAFDTGRIDVTGGGQVTLPSLVNYAKGVSCGTTLWRVIGPGSRLDASSIVNLSGGRCVALRIQALDGGSVLLPGVVTLPDGHLTVLADGTNSLVDFSSLQECQGTVRITSLEASDGGSVEVPQLTGGPKVSVILRPGGSLPIAQMTELAGITVEGRTESFDSLEAFDSGSFTLRDGAMVSVPLLSSYARNTTCRTIDWEVNGAGSHLDLSSLTNLTGGQCSPVRVEALAGGTVLLPGIDTLPMGHISVLADGTNSLVDLSALQTCPDTVRTTTLEAKNGGTVRVSQLTGGPKVSVILRPGGNMAVSQMVELAGITVEERIQTFSSLVAFDSGRITMSGGSMVSLPLLTSYTRNDNCGNINWLLDGTDTLLDLSSLTNLNGGNCSPIRMEAREGATILLTNLTTIEEGHVSVLADGTNSLVDLSSLRSCPDAGRTTVLEADRGGTINVPLLVGGPKVSVILRPGGTLPVSQMTELDGITVEGRTETFDSLVVFDSGSFNLSSGGMVSAPLLRSYTRNSTCRTIDWRVSDAGSTLDLSSLTNLVGGHCAPVAIQALDGGTVRLPGIVMLPDGHVSALANGTDSLVEFPSLLESPGTVRELTLEATDGGTVWVPQLVGGPKVNVILRLDGILPVSQMTELGGIIVDERAADFLSLVAFDNGTVDVDGGAVVTLPQLSSLTMGSFCGDVSWLVSGPGSRLNAPSLARVIGGSCGFINLHALAGGTLDLGGLQTIPDGNVHVLADGAGSVVDLRGLNHFFNVQRQSMLEALNGGTILFSQQPFLLSKVAIHIAPGNTNHPPAQIAGNQLTLHGRAWHSYWIDKRDASMTNSPWTFFRRVPLTNDFQDFARPPLTNDIFQITEFIADPPIVDLFRSGSATNLGLVLYGAPPKSYQVLTTNSLETSPPAWGAWAATGAMTNSFRIFPSIGSGEPRRYFQAVEE